jgi:probable blue pigment (indigoidine) exporter
MHARRLGPGSHAAIAALTPILWGTTYLVTTELLPPGRPMLAALVRALPVGIVFLLWRRQLPHGAWWWKAAVLGLLNIGIFFAGLFVAAYRLPGGVAATVVASQPIVASGLAVALLGERFTRRTALAGLAGLAGVAMLALQPTAKPDAIGLIAALVTALCGASGVVMIKRWGRPVDLLTFTGWQLVAGGLFLLPITLIAEGLPTQLTLNNVAGFLWIAIPGTGFAYANWFYGVGRLPVSVVSFLTLLSPMVATLLGWVVLGQALGPVQIAGAALVLTAILLPQLRARRPTASPTGSSA